MPCTRCHILVYTFLFSWLVQCTTPGDQGPSPARKAGDERRTFVVDKGLEVQLVASEPDIQDPIVLTFDEDGRLWVVEMRGFMPDIDGTGERDRVGRISILEDEDGDGAMDKHFVYLDSLIMPRALAVVKGGALVVEQEALWFVSDTNGDGRADKKELVDKDYAGSKMPEHSGNGLLRGMDNWYYNAKSRFRYALRDGRWIRDSTEFRGQWGISQDNAGRLYYNYNWSQLHADLVPPNYVYRNRHHVPTSGIDYGVTKDRRVYPIRDNPAVNRGYIPGTLSASGRLLEFTAACSPYYYRNHALPAQYHHNVFVCEPSGNLIKRNVVRHDGNFVGAVDPNPGREFMASTDERFRPVFITSGPDGALYVADMYRGLIQHGAYVTPYLREQTISRKLAKPVHCGRIWRIVSADHKFEKAEKLSTASATRLVELLAHPNGWYRDVAQRLLVERNDMAVRKDLLAMASASSADPIARLHALWTLEGMHALDENVLISLLDDQSSLIKTTALRLLEPAIKDNPATALRIDRALQQLANGNQPEILQCALSAYALPVAQRSNLLRQILLRNDTSALQRDAVMSSAAGLELDLMRSLTRDASWKQATPSREIVTEMLTSAVLLERNPAKILSLMAMVGADLPWYSRSILTGMATQGASIKSNPITLPSAPPVLLPGHPLSRRQAVRDQLSKIETMLAWPGHTPSRDAAINNAKLSDADLEQFALGRKHYLATCAGCHGTNGEGMQRMAPPLAGSDWVVGNEKRLALLILHGLEGAVDVAGKMYDAPEILPVMPSHSTMDDGAIRAVMTYIRNEWGNHASAIPGRLVGTTRHTSQGRVQPWTAAELNAFIEKYRDVPKPQ